MLPNLYPLRFILSVFVILYHIPGVSMRLGFAYYDEAAFLDKGLVAVYYFFTLSGFLIIRLIYLELVKTGTFDFKKFFIRRIQRLYPVYYLVLIIGIVLYHIILPTLAIPKPIDYDLSSLILHYIFLIPNVFQYYYNPGSIVQVLWSIGIEEQFYLLIPPILYLGRKNIVRTLAVLLFITVALLFIDFELYKYRTYFFYFVFGGLCAVISEQRRFKFLSNKAVQLVVYSCFILSFTTQLFVFGEPYLALEHFLQMIFSGLTLVLLTYYPLFILENKIVNYLGKISYGVYMYHMIVVTGLFFIMGRLDYKGQENPILFIISFNVLAILITTIVAALSYEYFEKLFYKPREEVANVNQKTTAWSKLVYRLKVAFS